MTALSGMSVRLVLAVCFGGLVLRFYPVFAGPPALAGMFMTEDGYLMLTVARNLAIGLGMSVSDGTIATNGVQPLATFLFATPYLATAGDKVAGLVGVHLLMIAIGVAAFFAIRALAARLFAGMAGLIPALPWIAAGLWFLGPLLARHSMNGLETGLITLMIALSLTWFHRLIDRGADAALSDRLVFGALCGVCVLARIDAALFCVAVFAVWGLDLLIRQRRGIGTVLAWLLPPGLLSLAIAAPWFLHNQLRFGSIMPISGPAQSLGFEVGQNAVLVPSKLFEYLFPMLPVPAGLEQVPALVAGFAVVSAVLILVFAVGALRAGGPAQRALIVAYLLYAAAITVYYGMFYGAGHFLSRYMAPLAPLLIVATLWVVTALARRLWPLRPQGPVLVYGFGSLALAGLLLVRTMLPGVQDQGHEQVVAWVEDNLADEVWVGAVQTGTLGYWHDRTINLDGKVNPEALAARRAGGSVLGYVVDSEVDYVVDWAGIGTWVETPGSDFAAAFELIVRDEAANLAVLRRRAGAE